MTKEKELNSVRHYQQLVVMTQIFGSLAYCRGKDLTFVLSDRQLTRAVQIAPGFYARNASKEPEDVDKVEVAGNHIFGIGGTSVSTGKEDLSVAQEDISSKISGILEHSPAYEAFLDWIREASGRNGYSNTYIFGTFGHRPRFQVGEIENGQVVREEERDTVALHRNGSRKSDGQTYNPHVKYWLDIEWLRGSIYDGRAFEGGEYKPSLDLMSQLFVEEMRRESVDYNLGVSKEWDTFVEVDGQVLQLGIYNPGIFRYKNGHNNLIEFLRNTKNLIASTEDEFLKELYLRVAFGAFQPIGFAANSMSFPRLYFERESPITEMFFLATTGEGFQRESMSQAEIGRFLEYMETLERFFLGELPRKKKPQKVLNVD